MTQSSHRSRIGSEIKAMRLSSGLTQQELAEKLGTNQGNVARIEAGKYNIAFDNLQKIADVFGRNVSFLTNSEADEYLSNDEQKRNS